MAAERQGYYELRDEWTRGEGVKAIAFAGNLLFNGMHWHSSLELLFCLKGQLRVNLAGEMVRMAAGDLLTIESGQSHEILDGAPGGLQIVASLDGSLLHRGEKERYALSTVGRYALPRQAEAIRSAERSLRWMTWLLTPDPALGDTPEALPLLQAEEGWNRYHRELYNLLWQLSRHKQAAEEPSRPDRIGPRENLRACLEILNRDFARELTAAAVARQVGVSEPTLYRLFKNQMGVSFSAYLNMIRVNAACGYLENTDWNMTTVAEKSGFASMSNFYRVFWQYRGCSPGAWQRQQVRQPGRRLPVHQDMMALNRFEPFSALPYGRVVLLEDTDFPG